MARSEARLRTAIWRDREYRALTQSGQWLYQFLMSQPDLSHAGVLPLRTARWAQCAADLSVEALERDLAELEQRRYVVVDRITGEVLVRTLVRNDGVYRQPNVLTNAVKSLDEVESVTILETLLAEIRRIVELPDVPARSRPLLADAEKLLLERLSAGGGMASEPDEPPQVEEPSLKDSENPAGKALDNPTAKGSGKGTTKTSRKSSTNPPAEPAPLLTVPTSAAKPPTPTQRSKAITDAYAAAEPMCKWPAVNAIVLRAIKADKWTDEEIRDALLRLAEEGRPVTVDTLRVELNGLPPARRAQPAQQQPVGRRSIPPDQQCPHHRGQPAGQHDNGAPRCAACRTEALVGGDT